MTEQTQWEAGEPEPVDEAGVLPVMPAEASEADALDQARPWGGEGDSEVPEVIELPPDAPEADALDQAMPVVGGPEDDDRR